MNLHGRALEKLLASLRERTSDVELSEYESRESLQALGSLSHLLRLRAERDEARQSKDAAYAERDQLVAALSKLFPSFLARHPEADAEWDDDWRWIVFVELPTGQASWHIHDSELDWFDHLDRRDGQWWDGHTTGEKYERLEALPCGDVEFVRGGR